jgi:predicted nuclease of predicted toxin-antitoxin system
LVCDWAKDPGDEEILTQAHREGRVLVTLDKDFGELAVVQLIGLMDFSLRGLL